VSFLLTQEQKINDVSYHRYYYPVPSGGMWATEGRTCDASEFEVARTRVHKASTSSSIRSTLHPDPSSSNLASSSEMCDKAVTNIDRVP
jgi:hypothetical protein